MNSDFSIGSLRDTKLCLVEENIIPDTFDDTQLPTDVHIVRYRIGDRTYFDAVRSYTMVDIFDVYHDRLADKGEVISIESGFGCIKPNLYSVKMSES